MPNDQQVKCQMTSKSTAQQKFKSTARLSSHQVKEPKPSAQEGPQIANPRGGGDLPYKYSSTSSFRGTEKFSQETSRSKQ